MISYTSLRDHYCTRSHISFSVYEIIIEIVQFKLIVFRYIFLKSHENNVDIGANCRQNIIDFS